MPTSPRTAHASHPWIRRTRDAARPLVFAHRGGAGLAPENTLAAFERAHALGVDGFELDVRLSKDDEVMVIHDAAVDRTTNGRGLVADLTVAELQRLDAGARFLANAPALAAAARATTAASNPAGPEVETTMSGEWAYPAAAARIPRLRDLLARFPDELLIIELKGTDPRLAVRAVEIVRAAGALDRTCFGGFSWLTLRDARRGGAQVCSSASREETRWALYRSWGMRIGLYLPWPWIQYQAFQVPERKGPRRVVSPSFLRAAHRAGLPVQVWTVNDEPDMRRLLGWGVDGLISDRPDRAIRVRDAFAAAAAAARPSPRAGNPAPAAAESGRPGTAGS